MRAATPISSNLANIFRIIPAMSFHIRIRLSIAVILLLVIGHGAAVYAAKPDKSDLTMFVGVDVDSLVTRLVTENGRGDISGLWNATTDGATIGIVNAKAWRQTTGFVIPDSGPAMDNLWVMVITASPDPMLQPGTVIGWLSRSAKPGYFKAQIYSKIKRGNPAALKAFTLHLADDAHLTMKAIHKGIEINPWRFLPYMIRGAVKYRNDTPADLDGFIKKWPRTYDADSPIYL